MIADKDGLKVATTNLSAKSALACVFRSLCIYEAVFGMTNCVSVAAMKDAPKAAFGAEGVAFNVFAFNSFPSRDAGWIENYAPSQDRWSW